MHQYSWQYLYDDYQEDEPELDSSKKEPVCVKTQLPPKDGVFCCKCKDFFHWAEPNQEDGVSFICRDCKLNPWRSSPLYPDD